MKSKIKQLVKEQIEPLLAAHGGGIEVVGIENGNTVKIKLTGACSTCPGRQQTIEQLVESVLKENIPEIETVSLQNEVSPDLIKQALGIIRHSR